MTSKRETIIETLYNKLKTLENGQIRVFRNLDKPLSVTSEGFIIVRDGKSTLSETLLSPVSYIFEHFCEIEAIVQNPTAETRHRLLDNLLSGIGQTIIQNRSLDSLAEWVEASPPEFLDEPIEGAATIRVAVIPVMVRFETDDPLI